MLSNGDINKYKDYEDIPVSLARIKFLINEKKSFLEWYQYKKNEDEN